MTRKSERVFYRKAKSQGIVKQVREKYVRHDIPCFMEGCTECQFDQAQLLDGKAEYFVIPDLSVIMRFLEILEQDEVTGLIISQTNMMTLEQHDKTKMYRRLRQLVNDPRKGSVLFYNEIFDATEQRRAPRETFDAYDWRCHCAIAKWYQEHTHRRILLLSEAHTRTDLPQDIQVNHQIDVCSMRDYLATHHKENALLASLVSVLADVNLDEDWHKIHMGTAVNAATGATGYTEHKAIDELEVGIKSGRFFSGLIRCRADRQQALVTAEPDKEILIVGNEHRNRAVHGDLVAIELLPESQWLSLSNRMSLESGDQDDESASAGATSISRASVNPTGHVVGVLQRNWRSYVATIQHDEAGGSMHLAIPLDPLIPKIRIRYQDVSLIENQRIVVRIDNWPVNSQYPNGHYVRSLGPIHQLDTEVSAILVEHGISVSQASKAFSEASLKEMPTDTRDHPWRPSDDQLAQRRDLRSLTVFSIDPPNCQDIDDALSIEDLGNGQLQLGVHIADVTYFVKENSKTDLEARARGTTVYLADRRFDMLPSVLSERVCSLRHQVDRYAVSVLWTLDTQLQVVDTWFGRTIIRSSCEMEYEQAQELLDGAKVAKGLDAALCRRLKPKVEQLAKVLRVFKSRRSAQGALELESSEVKFKTVDKDKVTEIIPKDELEIHGLVAEAMILANSAVGKRIYDGFKSAALLRRHPPARENKFKQLVNAAASRGFTVDFRSNRALAQSLAAIVSNSPDKPEMVQMLKTMATYAMNEAGYISSGQHSVDEYYHYGLALEYYTHFTSPIRRYADVIVHRQLLMAINDPTAVAADAGAASSMYQNLKIADICDNLNLKSRESKFAQRDSTELFQALYVMQQSQSGPLVANGIICEMRSNGFYVFVPSLGLKGPVFLLDKDDHVTAPLSLISDKVDDDDTYIPNCVLETELPTSVTVRGASLARPFRFALFDHVRVVLKLRESHAHRHLVYMSLLGFQETAVPSKRITNKEMMASIQTREQEHAENGTAAARDASSNGTALSKSDIQTRRMIKKHHGNMYSVLEKFRQLSLVENSSRQ
ncbi:DIS3-like exonuclease 1-like protein [Gongronella butleri]|nr:DIS3-like exonuclease 1-like protein [Gongronella butleri]